jgi:T5orf172 domain
VGKKIVLEGGTCARKPEHCQETYFLGCYTKSGKLRAVKIGTCARGSVKIRLRNLQTGSLDALKILGVYNGAVEKKLHRQFAKSRLRRKSEFFKPTKDLLALIVKLNVINNDLERLAALVAADEEKPQPVVGKKG